MTWSLLEIKPGAAWGGEHALIGARVIGRVPRAVVNLFDPAIVLEFAEDRARHFMTRLLYDGKIRDTADKAVEIGARSTGSARRPGDSPADCAAKKKDLQWCAGR